MTFEDLIKKLKDEKKGAEGVLEAWLDEYQSVRVAINEMIYGRSIRGKIILELYQDLQERKSKIYHDIYGFIWGLYAAGYITDKEWDELTDELLKEEERC